MFRNLVWVLATMTLFVTSVSDSEIDTYTDNEILKIATWNLRGLAGKIVEDEVLNDEQSIDQLVKYILGKQFDLIAIQEFRNEDEEEENLLRKFTQKLGGNYESNYSERVGWKNSDHKERLVFVWNSKKIRLKEDSFDLFQKDPVPKENGKDNFHRSPYYATFEMKNGNDFDFTVINVHLDSSKKTAKEELKQLARVDEYVQGTNGTEKEGGDDDILIMGDFNVDLITSKNAYNALTNLGYTPVVNKGYTNLAADQIIDNIFYNRKYTHMESNKKYPGEIGMRNTVDGFDHNPVWVEIGTTETFRYSTEP